MVPISNYKDLNKKHIRAQNEIGFIKVIVLPLWKLLDDIILEKRIQHSHLSVNIYYYIEQDSHNIYTDVVIMDFRRMISNLINNAIEAIQNKGDVTVHLSRNSKSF